MTFLPQLMNMTGVLSFSREGKWMHDGEEVTHQGLAGYLSRHLNFYPELGFVVEDGGRSVRIEIEDTPFVVRTIDSGQTPWTMFLNDDTEEAFIAETLRARTAGGFTVMVKGGRFSATLLRPAVQAILPFVAEAPNGAYVLNYAGVAIEIARE